MTVASGASSHVWLKIPDWWVKTESEQPWGSETRPPGATGPGSQRSASAPKSRWPGAGGGGAGATFPPAAGVAQSAQARPGWPGGERPLSGGGPAGPSPPRAVGGCRCEQPVSGDAAGSDVAGRFPRRRCRVWCDPGGRGGAWPHVAACRGRGCLWLDTGCFCASPAVFAGGQCYRGAEKVKNLQICGLKSCVPTHRKAESEAAVRPPADAVSARGPRREEGPRPWPSVGVSAVQGQAGAPPHPARRPRGTQAGGTEQGPPGAGGGVQDQWVRAAEGGDRPRARGRPGRPLAPGAPGLAPKQRPARPLHPLSNPDPVFSR